MYRQWNGQYCRALDNSEYAELSEYMLNLIGVWEPVMDFSKESYHSVSKHLSRLRSQYKNMNENERISTGGRLIIKQIKEIDMKLKGVDRSIPTRSTFNNKDDWFTTWVKRSSLTN